MSIQPRLRDPLDDTGALTTDFASVQVMQVGDLHQQLRFARRPARGKREVTPKFLATCLLCTLIFMISIIIIPELAYHKYYPPGENDTNSDTPP